MKWRFWQKAYLATLLLFLFSLFVGTLGIALVSWRQNLSSETEKALVYQKSMKTRISQSIQNIGAENEWALSALLEAYGKNASQNGGAIELRRETEVLYSNLPYYGEERPELHLERDNTNWLFREINDNTYIVVSSRLPGTAIVFTYSHDSTALFIRWRQMTLVYVFGCTSISLVFAVLLYIILRRLSIPLEKLTQHSRQIAEGDYTARLESSSQDEISELTISFNNMVATIVQNIEQLENTARQKQQLLDNLSHEIRTPLTAIQGYAEYVEQAEVSYEQIHSIMQKIQNETNRLKRIAELLLSLSSFQNESLEMKQVSLNAVIDAVKETLLFLAAKNNVDIEWICPMKETIVMGDFTLLESLIINLTENAIKACKTSGAVSVLVTDVDGVISILVSDNGHGMDEEQLSHLGEVFFRVDKSRARLEGGAGLGVALCYQIAKMHDTKLIYTSEIDKGTTVRIDF